MDTPSALSNPDGTAHAPPKRGVFGLSRRKALPMLFWALMLASYPAMVLMIAATWAGMNAAGVPFGQAVAWSTVWIGAYLAFQWWLVRRYERATAKAAQSREVARP